MSTTTAAPAKKAAARKTVDKDAVHAAEREAADRLEAERQARVDRRDNPPPVHVAWARVMSDVKGVGKHGQNREQGYKFRGIDDVMNAVGPAMREHGVIILPEVQDITYRDVRTTRDKPAREVTVQVRYTIVGPDGETISGLTAGESMDSSDKGTAKAMSVAYRVFLLQALCLPTDEPSTDEEYVERGDDLTPAEKVAKGLPTVVATERLEALRIWSVERNLLNEQVTGPQGPIRLEELFDIHAKRISEREANVAKATGGEQKAEGQ